MNSTNRDIIEQVFRAVFELDPDANLDVLKRQWSDCWDSMAHVALISALDDEFELIITSEDAVAMTSFARCVEVLERYLG